MGAKVWRRLMRRKTAATSRRPAARAAPGLELLEARAVPSATHFILTGASSATAGTALLVTVRAVERPDETDPSYLGKVHFTSTDRQAVLPADYTFTPSDDGRHLFSIILKTAGSQTITATDAARPEFDGTLEDRLVSPAAATSFAVTGFPDTTAGAEHSFTVTAQDPYGNTDTNYQGTVRFGSSAPNYDLPAPYTFLSTDAGQRTFSGQLNTAGTQTVIAQDVENDSVNGAQSGISVAPGPTTGFLIDTPTGAGQGSQFDVTVTAVDHYDNPTPLYLSTVHFTSTDPLAVLPPDYQFRPADNAVHTFNGVVFQTTGTQVVRATDVFTISQTGISSILVTPSERTADNVPPDVAMVDEYVLAEVGELVAVRGSYSDPGGKPLTATIDFDDGTGPQPLILRADGTFAATHVFTRDDVFDVTVSVADGVDSGTADTLALVFAPELQDGASQAVPPGETATASALGVTARVYHTSGADRPAVLTVGHYDTLPVPGFALVPGDLTTFAAYELRLASAGPDDRVTVTFSFPEGDEGDVRLEFYDPQTRTFRPVEPSLLAPGSFVIDEARHTVTFVLDPTSFPRVTDLRGTIFTVSVVIPVFPAAAAAPPAAGRGMVFAAQAVSPPVFVGTGQRTLTLSPSPDGGPSLARANLSGEGHERGAEPSPDAALLAQTVAEPVRDTWPLGGDDPFARWVPTWDAVGSAGRPEPVSSAREDLWPLGPTLPIPEEPPPETSPRDDHGALPRRTEDEFWTGRTPEERASPLGAAAAAALTVGLTADRSGRYRKPKLPGGNSPLR
jgi:hypothetical protein